MPRLTNHRTQEIHAYTLTNLPAEEEAIVGDIASTHDISAKWARALLAKWAGDGLVKRSAKGVISRTGEGSKRLRALEKEIAARSV